MNLVRSEFAAIILIRCVNAIKIGFANNSPQTHSPVEFELLLEKITIKRLNSLSYTEFSEDYENYP